MDQRIRLAVVNDYDVVVEGVAGILRRYREEIRIVQLDSSAGQEAEDEPGVDIALVDTFAHPPGDCDAVARLVESGRAHHVVVYSWNLDPALIQRALDRGVHGYLSKMAPAAELVAALGKVMHGEVVVDADVVRVGQVPGDWPGREEGLTPREAEMVALITRGLSNEEIVNQTLLSPNTIKSYIRAAYRKIGVTTRSRAVLWGIEHGFRPDHQLSSR